MNIAVCCFPTHGGSGVMATELGKTMAEQGHKVHFISFDKPFRLFKKQKNIFFHRVRECDYPVFKHPQYLMPLINKIVEVAEQYDIDIIHGHYAVPYSTSMVFAKDILGTDIKTITTLHGTDVTILGRDKSIKRVVEYSINRSDGITVPSMYLAKKVIDCFSVTNDIEIINNFVDTQIFKRNYDPELRRSFVEKDEKLLIHISNFRSVKRVNDVVKTFAGISKGAKSKLLMVGDGPDREMACKLAQKLNIADKVKFLGKQQNVVDLLSISDLFLLPSGEESFGLALLEAMACNVPAVASNAGGIPEVLSNGITGFIKDVGDIDGMVESGLTILSDKYLHERMSQNARTIVEEKFSSERLISQYIDYYYRILNKDKFRTIA